VRILHLTDRLGGRGGAHRHLEGVVQRLLAEGHEVHLAGGGQDGDLDPSIITSILDGLAARDARPVDLTPLVERVRPDVIHVHAVVNPCVLEWARTAAGGYDADRLMGDLVKLYERVAAR
jgi:Glycosyltransferase Family 4